jgi:hypothetical protein
VTLITGNARLDEQIQAMDPRLIALAKKAWNGGLPISARHWKADAPAFPISEDSKPWLGIEFGGGHSLSVHPEDADKLTDLSFEDWRGIRGYNAFYDVKRNQVLAQVRGSGYDRAGLAAVEGFRTTSTGAEERTSRPSGVIKLHSTNSEHVLQLWTGDLCPDLVTFTSGFRSDYCLSIENVVDQPHDHVRDLLCKLTSSLFLEIDTRYGLLLSLARAWRPQLDDGDADELGRGPLTFPSVSYEEDALELYFYARERGRSNLLNSAPLVSYLAYYQVIEYFMPAYSKADQHNRLKTILADPGLDPRDDIKVGRVLALLEKAAKRMSEREQLRVTISACIDETELRHFLAGRDAIARKLADITYLTEVTPIGLDAEGAVLLRLVADRVYDLRCRIVHTKDSVAGGAAAKALFPSSPEADRLGPDLELISFLARRVLVASKREIKL